jgi:hypothetical protein
MQQPSWCQLADYYIKDDNLYIKYEGEADYNNN